MYDQPSQWMYDEEYSSIVLDKHIFPNKLTLKELTDLIYQLEWDVIMDAVYIGVNQYIEDVYGKN